MNQELITAGETSLDLDSAEAICLDVSGNGQIDTVILPLEEGGSALVMDSDDNGSWDTVCLDQDEASGYETIYMDTDEDGHFDLLAVDSDGDGALDTVLSDEDGDGDYELYQG